MNVRLNLLAVILALLPIQAYAQQPPQPILQSAAQVHSYAVRNHLTP